MRSASVYFSEATIGWRRSQDSCSAQCFCPLKMTSEKVGQNPALLSNFCFSKEKMFPYLCVCEVNEMLRWSFVAAVNVAHLLHLAKMPALTWANPDAHPVHVLLRILVGRDRPAGTVPIRATRLGERYVWRYRTAYVAMAGKSECRHSASVPVVVVVLVGRVSDALPVADVAHLWLQSKQMRGRPLPCPPLPLSHLSTWNPFFRSRIFISTRQRQKSRQKTAFETASEPTCFQLATDPISATTSLFFFFPHYNEHKKGWCKDVWGLLRGRLRFRDHVWFAYETIPIAEDQKLLIYLLKFEWRAKKRGGGK